MKWFKRISLSLLALVLVLVGGCLLFVRFGLPKNIPAPAIAIPKNDTALISRGRYLVNHVSPCFVCHSPRDHTRFSEPVLLDSIGAGKMGFGHKEHFPGEMYFTNITPSYLSNWSDGELYRVITSGIRKNGEPVFPFMPYPFLGQMDSMDVVSIIAYLRTIRPIDKPSGESDIDFPVNLIIRTIPDKPKPIHLPVNPTLEERGYYLATVGLCVVCHTPTDDKDRIIENRKFEGGRRFYLDNFVITSANLTPDEETGIGSWSEQAFLNRFRSYADVRHAPQLQPGDPITTMPWAEYAGMKDEDLKAIYHYLRTLKPVKNEDKPSFAPQSKEMANN